MPENKQDDSEELKKKIENLKAGRKTTRDGRLIIEKMERPEPWPEPPDDEEKR